MSMMTDVVYPEDPAPPPDDATRLMLLCRALGNPTRVQIVQYVLHHPDCIGNQILLHLPDDGPHAQSTLSRHLRVLRQAGILEAHADGSAVCYRVATDAVYWLAAVLQQWATEGTVALPRHPYTPYH